MPSTRRSTPAGEAPGAAPAPDAAASEPRLRVLKKYPNRRLYDTQSSCYITLADVKKMVLEGTTFEVRDAKSGEDLTRSILLQIILEEESAGVPMFSTQMLSQIIRFYGHAMQGVMGTLLERNLAAFAEMQARFLEQSAGLYDPKRLTPEAWAQFIGGQAPALQTFMTDYLQHSRELFEQMQRGALFTGMPGFTPPAKK